MSGLVLSLFPGIGLLDRAFEEEGFCVVRGPDLLWGGDIKAFHPQAGKFDGVIGGPPCQHFSRLRYLVEHNGYTVAPNLIPEFERVIWEARPRWFLMENVPEAPTPRIEGYCTDEAYLNNRWLGEEQNRLRKFVFGGWWPVVQRLDIRAQCAIFESQGWAPAVLASGGHREVPVALGGSGKRKRKSRHTGRHLSGEYFARACELQGLPADFLKDAPLTVEGKIRVVGNGVPLPMGRAIARAVKQALAERVA